MPDAVIPVRWQPDRQPVSRPWPVPSLRDAMVRGACGRCPACGQTRAFAGFLRVVPECAACGAPLGELRADDAPPYFTVFIVAHVVIALLTATEFRFAPPMWLEAVVWLPFTVLLSVALLRPIKGATLGLMLRLDMLKPVNE